jgi:predicted dithiol-disulfide oxidoreductase (DUF899 family)
MIVRFSNRKAKTAVLAARKELRRQEDCKYVFGNEQMTKSAVELFEKARELVKQRKIQRAWTWNCKIFVKTNAGQTKMISKYLDLCKL